MSEFKIKTTRDFVLMANPYIKGKVLDAGGGDAKYKSIISQTASSYTCLDIAGGPNVDIVGDVLNMPFETESFDTVICNQVLEHIKEPEKLFSEAYRVLRRGGFFVCTAPFLEPNHADPNDYFRYTKEALGLIASRHNFKVIKIGAYGSLPTVIFSFIKFKLFNPYKKQSRIKKSILRRLTNVSLAFDGYVDTGIIYSDSFLIAQK